MTVLSQLQTWLNLEVIEKGENVFKKYSNNDILTNIDQIIKYEYETNTLTPNP
jgi:hypothetical protein